MKPLAITVRPLAPDDISAVSARLGLARLGDARGTYLVAWDDAVPVGHARLTSQDPPQLQDVEVHPDRRRRGVARELVTTAATLAAARGATVLRLTVSATHDDAHALYRSLGFRPANLPPYRVTGVIAIRTGPLTVDDVLVIWERRLR
jgi:ribosomal protein S18 acetylase RimI-like enzyme